MYLSNVCVFNYPIQKYLFRKLCIYSLVALFVLDAYNPSEK